MSKYNLDYCKENKVAVKCETQEDEDIVREMSGFDDYVRQEKTGHINLVFNKGWYKKADIEKYEIITASDFVKSQKWCVKRTTENHKAVNDWFNENTEWGRDNGYVEYTGYMHFPKISKCSHDRKSGVQDGYHELTFEQFKKYILNENATAMDKKIRGYKAPTSLFDGFVEAGIVYKQSNKRPETYFPDIHPGNTDYNLPKEIVETWEPVYESTKKTVTLRSKQGDFTVDVEPGKSIKYGTSCDCDYTTIPIGDLKNVVALISPVNVAGWVVKLGAVSIGCKHEIPISDIQKVIDAYEK